MVEFLGGLALGIALTVGSIVIVAAYAVDYAAGLEEKDLDFGYDPRTASLP